MERIRFAVVGCGLMGQRHAHIIGATPECQLISVYDKDRGRAEKAAGSARIAKDFQEILEDDSIDAVVLAVPTHLHADLGAQVAQARKHVVMEKPLAIDVGSGEQLLGKCAKNGVLCAVISQNRFADGNMALYWALREGLLGKPILARGSVKWFRHDEYYTQSDWRGRLKGEGGGVLMNQATHTLDLLLWFFGYPQTIAGLTASTRPVLETEDVAVALFRFPGGPLATFEATTSAFPGFEERVEVHGPTGSCMNEKGKMVYWKHSADVPPPPPPHFDPPTEQLDPRFVLFQRQYRNILRAIRGEEALVVKPEEALAVVRMTRAVYENVLD